MLEAMGRATSIILGEHFDELIAQQVQTGRYGTASKIVRDALRMFEERQAAVQRLNEAIDKVLIVVSLMLLIGTRWTSEQIKR